MGDERHDICREEKHVLASKLELRRILVLGSLESVSHGGAQVRLNLETSGKRTGVVEFKVGVVLELPKISLVVDVNHNRVVTL